MYDVRYVSIRLTLYRIPYIKWEFVPNARRRMTFAQFAYLASYWNFNLIAKRPNSKISFII